MALSHSIVGALDRSTTACAVRGQRPARLQIHRRARSVRSPRQVRQVGRNLQEFAWPGGCERAAISSRRVTHLSIINRRGQKQIPLHAGFVGFGAVLNDGKTPNTLVLRVSNILKEHPITWNPVGSSEPTSLYVSFDVHPKDVPEDWTLGDKGQVGAIDVGYPNTWQRTTPNSQDESPRWTLQPTTDSLAPGETVQFPLSNIKTDAPTGQTNLYVQYVNVPGYWDGQLVVPIEKSPLLYMGNNIGIGTTNPPARLTVSASDNHLQLRRERDDTAGGSHVFLELFQDDADPAILPEVYPSIRFNHNYRFWSRLEGVPFEYLVPDERLLPTESIRFFWLDSLWID